MRDLMVQISAEVLKVIREAAAEQETSPGAFAGKILTDWVRQYDYEKNHPDNMDNAEQIHQEMLALMKSLQRK